MAESYDVVVIGGGPGGYIAAIRASQLGLKTACIESRGTLGGTCLNVGCIPSKALLESSEIFVKVQDASHWGIKVSGAKVDLPAMLQRKDGIVSQLTRGVEGLFKKNKVTYYKGFGSFRSKNEIDIKAIDGKDVTIKTQNTIIATGSAPIEIPIAKFDEKVVVSSTGALSFEKIPKHLIVIGGGVIGLELGSVWKRLGAEVTVIEAMPEILYTMDETVRREMRKVLEKQGIKFHTDTKVTNVANDKKKAVVTAEHKGENIELEADRVLVAVGRRAYTDGLNVEAAGVKVDERGRVEIDGHFRTSASNIYAIGDVVKGPMLAHKAEDEGVACAEIIAGKPGHVNYEAIPSVVYTWPEVASVGAPEQELKDKGIKYKVGKIPFMANGRAKCAGHTDGFVKIIADATTDRVLGAHIVGPNASELIAELAVAIEFKTSAEDIARSTHAHPTLAETVKEAALAVDKRTLNF